VKKLIRYTNFDSLKSGKCTDADTTVPVEKADLEAFVNVLKSNLVKNSKKKESGHGK